MPANGQQAQIQLSVLIPEELYDALAATAHHENRSLAAIVRAALAEHCHVPHVAHVPHGNTRYATHAQKLAARRARAALQRAQQTTQRRAS
jgi:hypothetical protein